LERLGWVSIAKGSIRVVDSYAGRTFQLAREFSGRPGLRFTRFMNVTLDVFTVNDRETITGDHQYSRSLAIIIFESVKGAAKVAVL